MHNSSKLFCIWCFLLIFLPGCLIPSRYFIRKNVFIAQPTEKQHLTCYTEPDRTITVWIHGTRFFFRDLYQRETPYQEGLYSAQNAELPYKLKQIALALNHNNPQRFKVDDTYIFGWSGKLCFIERETAAHRLFNELITIQENYRKQYAAVPKIRIIAHSHGGNVALNLVLNNQDNELIIDELILLACPVQEKTKHLIDHAMFKKVYVLYSAFDIVQILDPQGIYTYRGRSHTFFSKRNFDHKPHIAQMKIKINRRAPTHCEFSKNSFLKLLPAILAGIDEWQHTVRYKEDPNKIQRLLCVYTKNKAKASKLC